MRSDPVSMATLGTHARRAFLQSYERKAAVALFAGVLGGTEAP
jgi:hypothetical protein